MGERLGRLGPLRTGEPVQDVRHGGAGFCGGGIVQPPAQPLEGDAQAIGPKQRGAAGIEAGANCGGSRVAGDAIEFAQQDFAFLDLLGQRGRLDQAGRADGEGSRQSDKGGDGKELVPGHGR